MKSEFEIRPIPQSQCREWIIKKHYAKRLPQVSLAFGLYDGTKTLRGVCTFGMPCRVFNDGEAVFGGKLKVRTLELNRLVVDDGLQRGVLSIFVSGCLKQLPRPMCVVSYADPNNGHHGYIYQATNWIYTGVCDTGGKSFDWILNGKYIHGRNVTEEYLRSIMDGKYDSGKDFYENFESIGGEIKSQEGKHRYFMFLGSKVERKNMKKAFAYSPESYPKGENKRYDSSYQPNSNAVLF